MKISRKAAETLADAYVAAWNAKAPAALAALFADNAQLTVNRGQPWSGQAGVTEMAVGFLDDVPDLTLRCDGVRPAGDHLLFLFTFTGHDGDSGAPVEVSGWEEWDLDPDGRIAVSRAWYDAEDYARQTAAS